ncbi:MAG: polysaccharide pyruvyl transferase family protein [Candidatus Gracilibacteria bacterium]|nr:polysaccharide pyruvyl transferase family protein [Candidatus Gracilibacteria bacterium]
MNIAILMSIGAQNLGDELILKNEIELLREKYNSNSINFKVFTYDLEYKFFEDSFVEYAEYFPIGIKNPKNLFRNLKNFIAFSKTLKWADKVIIGGGGIIYDNETQSVGNPLNQWLFRVKMREYYKKDIIFYGVSIEVSQNSKNLELVKQIFLPAKEIYLRNRYSYELLKSLLIHSEIILDPVFSDNGKKTDFQFPILKLEASNFEIDNFKQINFTDKKVGLAFRSGKLQNENKKIEDLINLILEKGGEVILLPHSFHKADILANDYEFLKQFVKEKVVITNSMQETYEIYKKNLIDLCISMRLHSMILSQVYEIDFISISYSKKTSEF